jgi:hypothetical protein
LSEEVEWGEPENPFNPAGETRKGHSGFLEWLNIGKNAEEILVLEPRRFLTDNDSVAVIGYMKCLAKSTSKIYESDFVRLARNLLFQIPTLEPVKLPKKLCETL